jgi:beta-glucosidase
VFVHGFDPEAVAGYATVVAGPEEADVALVRLHAPYEQRSTMFENFFHAGSLDFPQETVDEVLAIARAVPTVLEVFLDRPAILTPFAGEVRAIAADFGASANALLDVLFGEAAPQGRLPMDLPSSMGAVLANRPDVPFDTADPLYRFGHGLSY